MQSGKDENDPKRDVAQKDFFLVAKFIADEVPQLQKNAQRKKERKVINGTVFLS